MVHYHRPPAGPIGKRHNITNHSSVSALRNCMEQELHKAFNTTHLEPLRYDHQEEVWRKENKKDEYLEEADAFVKEFESAKAKSTWEPAARTSPIELIDDFAKNLKQWVFALQRGSATSSEMRLLRSEVIKNVLTLDALGRRRRRLFSPAFAELADLIANSMA